MIGDCKRIFKLFIWEQLFWLISNIVSLSKIVTIYKNSKKEKEFDSQRAIFFITYCLTCLFIIFVLINKFLKEFSSKQFPSYIIKICSSIISFINLVVAFLIFDKYLIKIIIPSGRI